ncbi:MAG: DUF2868 domain-containing protein, partial [Comamonadaceae bacterium]|nr:DUF2868 domain-containing protein [Comamonadaceae bacterium]
LTGWLPAQLGFAVPDAATVRQAASGMLGTSGTAMNAGAGGQRAWAFWLLGCVAVYGLLPRAVLAALCLWRWRAGLARLAEADAVVDTASPYVRRIFTRLDALAPAQVVDAEQRPPAAALPPPAPAGQPGTLALIGFERPPELPWPPEGWPATLRAQPLLNLAGSSAERQAALAQLAATRPWRLLVACAPHASPDRGTARFLREAARHATHAALWLPEAPMPAADPADPAAPASADARGPARWRDWLQAEDLAPRITLLHGPQAAAWAGEDAPLAAPAPATHNA